MSLIALMGYLDDVYNLKSYIKLGFQALAAVIVILGGIRIQEISIPFLQDMVVFNNTLSNNRWNKNRRNNITIFTK